MYLLQSVLLSDLILTCFSIELERAIILILLPEITFQSFRKPISLIKLGRKHLNAKYTDLGDVENARLRKCSYYYCNDRNIGRIIGGYEVALNQFPYHVAYGKDCGGAIIAQLWVLTAAHCDKLPTIRAGAMTSYAGGSLHSVIEHIPHPMWQKKPAIDVYDYDFQLLKLLKPLTLSSSIKAVRVGRPSDLEVGKYVTVTGFGRTSEFGSSSAVLRSIRIPLVSLERCKEMLLLYFKGILTSRMFCAGYSQVRIDACQGDSGSPAVMKDRLVGLVSFGYGCALPGTYGIYSNVTAVRPWIEQVTGNHFD